ncbi:hypothetical protein M758_3G179500 [Ceratodon purpureus]|nr:hypothetical protein M758_3G179500 [Ceratodon purpureus]
MMDLNGASWSDLPFELEQQVLSLLPLPHLRRYCTTCKRWNWLINDPAFSMLHTRNKKKHSPFITIHAIPALIQNGRAVHCDESQVLCILDITSKKWYSMKPFDALQKSFPFDYGHFLIMAMDGGLMLVKDVKNERRLYFASDIPIQLRIWNPIKNIQIKLPCVSNHGYLNVCPLMNFVVDDTSEKFKVFLINRHYDGPIVDIYDSDTKRWKASSRLKSNYRKNYIPRHSIVYQNLLYILFVIFDEVVYIGRNYEFWRYNPLVDFWERLHIAPCFIQHDHINNSHGYFQQFFTIGEHFFCTYWSGEKLFELHEIDISNMSTTKLLTWTTTEVTTIFDIDLECSLGLDFLQVYVIGFHNSLMLMTDQSRKIVTFDLETKEIDLEWPHLPLEKLRTKGMHSLVGKQMNLLLPGTLK